MINFKETAWNHIQGESTGTFFTAELKWINKIHKWKEQYPDEVQIQHINEDGSIIVWLPQSWCKISPKKRVSMTDEQRDAARNRLTKYREKLQYKSNEKEGNKDNS